MWRGFPRTPTYFSNYSTFENRVSILIRTTHHPHIISFFITNLGICCFRNRNSSCVEQPSEGGEQDLLPTAVKVEPFFKIAYTSGQKLKQCFSKKTPQPCSSSKFLNAAGRWQNLGIKNQPCSLSGGRAMNSGVPKTPFSFQAGSGAGVPC